MTIQSIFISLAVTLFCCSFSAYAQIHPIVGKWQWTRDVNKCTEVYDYRPDGSLHVVSGEEVTESIYDISPQSDSNGFYTLNVKTVKTNKGRDCSDGGGGDDQSYTNYIIFHRTQPFHLACYKPSLDQCFGPLRRIDTSASLPNYQVDRDAPQAVRPSPKR